MLYTVYRGGQISGDDQEARAKEKAEERDRREEQGEEGEGGGQKTK